MANEKSEQQTTAEEVTPVKTYTQQEVDQMLAKEKDELRETAVTAMAQKQAEIKKDLMLSGQDDDYSIAKWEVMKRMSEDMVKSGALPSKDNAYTIMIKMQAGREMGLKPLESIKSLYIVNGVVSIWGSAVIRRLREHGWKIKYEEKQDSCTATVYKEEEEYTDTFTFEDARKSGWTGGSSLKPGWVDGVNRQLKLRYGVISKILKTYIPEVLGSASDLAEVAMDTMPLYSGTEQVTKEPVDDGKPATDVQKENIKKLIGYEKMEDEGKQLADEWINGLTFAQASNKMAELAKAKQQKGEKKNDSN